MSAKLAAQTRKDGTTAELRSPQDLTLAILRADLTPAELRCVLVIHFRQFQFAEDGEEPQAIYLEDFGRIAGLPRSSTLKALADLEARGLICRRPGGGRGHPSAFALVLATWRKGLTGETVSPPIKGPADETVSGLKGLTGETKGSHWRDETVQPAGPIALHIDAGESTISTKSTNESTAPAGAESGSKDPDGDGARPDPDAELLKHVFEAMAGRMSPLDIQAVRAWRYAYDRLSEFEIKAEVSDTAAKYRARGQTIRSAKLFEGPLGERQARKVDAGERRPRPNGQGLTAIGDLLAKVAARS